MSCFENLTLHFGHNLPKNLHDATPPLSLSYSTGHTLTFEGFRQAEVTNVQLPLRHREWKEEALPPRHVVMAVKHDPFRLTQTS